MTLQYPEEIHDFAVSVIDHFGAWDSFSAEEHATHADKNLRIYRVWSGCDQFADLAGENDLTNRLTPQMDVFPDYPAPIGRKDANVTANWR